MLVRFSVSNFLSFNGRTEFGMESGRVTKKTEHLLLDEGAKKSLLKFAAIYGKNGAGKSNLVRALNVLRGFVLSGKLPRRAPSLWCRICDANEAMPTDFSVEFIAEGATSSSSLLRRRTGISISMRSSSCTQSAGSGWSSAWRARATGRTASSSCLRFSSAGRRRSTSWTR